MKFGCDLFAFHGAAAAAECLLVVFTACILADGQPPTKLRRRAASLATVHSAVSAPPPARFVLPTTQFRAVTLAPVPGGGRRRRRRRRPSDECERSYVTHIADHCRYPGMATPCFVTADTNATSNRTDGEDEAWNATVSRTAHECCAGGRRCGAQSFERLCCRAPACLARCYGADFYARRRHVGGPPDRLAAGATRPDSRQPAEDCSREKWRRRYRFLAIITRPNPNRPQQRPWADDKLTHES